MEKREQSSDLADLAFELINSDPMLEHIKESEVCIGYLTSDLEKMSNGNPVFGECEKVPAKYRWAIPYDFTVTIFSPNVERFTDEQMRILVLHELLHVDIEKDGNEERYRCAPHDVEDFVAIVKKYGLRWWA